MTITTKQTSKHVTVLLNGTLTSLKSVVPINYRISKPQVLEQSLKLQFGVLIGITGDIKGNLILAGEESVFAAVGKTMFGMPLEGKCWNLLVES